MSRTLFVVLSLSLLATACGSSDPGAGDVGNAITDTGAMEEATSAANQIIRNAADCDVVQSNIRDVNATLDRIESNLQTAAGRTSMGSLRKQVNTVADACGAR